MITNPGIYDARTLRRVGDADAQVVDTLLAHRLFAATTPKSLPALAHIHAYCEEDVRFTRWIIGEHEIQRHLHEDHALANALRGTGLVALIAGGVA